MGRGRDPPDALSCERPSAHDRHLPHPRARPGAIPRTDRWRPERQLPRRPARRRRRGGRMVTGRARYHFRRARIRRRPPCRRRRRARGRRRRRPRRRTRLDRGPPRGALIARPRTSRVAGPETRVLRARDHAAHDSRVRSATRVLGRAPRERGATRASCRWRSRCRARPRPPSRCRRLPGGRPRAAPCPAPAARLPG